MTDIPVIPSMRPEPARDGFGRYRLPDPNTGRERSWTRATTLAGTLSDTYAISKWRQRMVAEGLTKRRDLLSRIPELARQVSDATDWREAKDAKALLDTVCDDAAAAAGADRGSSLGTLLHTATEYMDAGRFEEIEHLVPLDLFGDLTAYRTTMDDAGIERPPQYIERIVINERVDSAGTFDRLVRLPDGRLIVADLKTQQSVEFGWLSIAIQLAEYVQADWMTDPATGELVPLPADLDTTIGLVMHLPAGLGECSLYSIDLVAGWEAALIAHEVRQWRTRSKSLGRPYVPTVTTQRVRPISIPAPYGAPDPDHHARTLYLVRSAQHVDSLTALWSDLDARGLWTDAHTAAARTRKAELTGAAA